jgi:hypothetical protein
MPVHCGRPGQAFGVGELALVPGHDRFGMSNSGLRDRFAAFAERSPGFGEGGSRCELVFGDCGQAGPGGQGDGNELCDPGPAPTVGCPTERGGGSKVAGCGRRSSGTGLAAVIVCGPAWVWTVR